MKRSLMFFSLVLLILAGNSILSAQNAPIDFEAGGYGADWTWTVFENDTNPPVEIIANPDAAGVNTSSTVAQFTALVTGQPWAGCETLHGSDIGTFNLDASNSTIKIMVNKPVISNVGIKLVKPDAWSMGELLVANTVVDEWEELTFDFAGQVTDGYDQIVIFPDFDMAGRTQDNVCYFDNITFHPQGQVEGPEAPATPPTVPAENVISLFSNVYTNVTVDTWSAEWDNADVADFQLDGDDMKRYFNLVFAGIEFTSQTIDATNMTHFHMDLWTPDPTSAPAVFNIKLVDFGADGVWGTDDVEHELSFDETTLATESWVNFDISLADFTGLTTTGHLAQMIISGDLSEVYLDNIYFYNDQSDADDNLISTPYQLQQNYPNPFNPVTKINFSIDQPGHVSLKIYDTKGRLVETLVDGNRSANTYQHTWNAANATSGIYFYSLSVDGNAVDTKRMILLK